MAGGACAVIRLILLRHGATAGNLERRYVGRTDEPLCETGVRQILALRGHGLYAGRLFVSPMLRARQTARLLFPDLSPTIVRGLAETDFGVFEGRSADELSGCCAYRRWVDGGCLGPIPGGESPGQFKARCRSAFARAVHTVPDGVPAAFVIHGGVIMALLEAYALPRRDFYRCHIGNGGYVLADWNQNVLRIVTVFRGAQP